MRITHYPLRITDCLVEPRDQSRNTIYRREDRVIYPDITKVTGYQELRFELAQRTPCQVQKLRELPLSRTCGAFSNIARDGYSRTPQLGSQPEQLLLGKSLREAVDGTHELSEHLPGVKVVVASRTRNG